MEWPSLVVVQIRRWPWPDTVLGAPLDSSRAADVWGRPYLAPRETNDEPLPKVRLLPRRSRAGRAVPRVRQGRRQDSAAARVLTRRICGSYLRFAACCVQTSTYARN